MRLRPGCQAFASAVAGSRAWGSLVLQTPLEGGRNCSWKWTKTTIKRECSMSPGCSPATWTRRARTTQPRAGQRPPRTPRICHTLLSSRATILTFLPAAGQLKPSSSGRCTKPPGVPAIALFGRLYTAFCADLTRASPLTLRPIEMHMSAVQKLFVQ